MAEKKPRPKPMTTPIGFVGPFAKLVQFDDYQGQKKFKVTLLLDQADADLITESAEYKAALAEARKLYEDAKRAAMQKGKKLPAFEEAQPFFEEVDRETGETTGRIAFRFGSGAEFEDRKTGKMIQRTVPFFTAKGVPIPKEKRQEPWQGSRIRVSYTLFPYANVGAKNLGVSLRLEAVKIIELRTGGGGQDASRYGFDSEDEGFEGDDTEDAMTSDDSSDDADGDEAPRF